MTLITNCENVYCVVGGVDVIKNKDKKIILSQ